MVSDYSTLLENLRARKLAQVDPVRTLATDDLPAAGGTPSFRSPGPESRKARLGKGLLSGTEFADFLSNDVFAHLPGFGKDRNSGQRIAAALEKAPVVGGLLKRAFDVGAAPLSIGTAGFGAPVAAGLKAAGPVGKVAASFAAPILTQGGMAARLGAETGIGVVGQVAAETVAEKTGSQLLGIGAGVLAGGAALRTVGKTRAWYTADDLPDADPVRKLFAAVTDWKAKPEVQPPDWTPLPKTASRAKAAGPATGQTDLNFGRSKTRPEALVFEAGARRSADFDVTQTPWAKGQGSWVDPNAPVDVRVAKQTGTVGRGPDLSGNARSAARGQTPVQAQVPAGPQLQMTRDDITELYRRVNDSKSFGTDNLRNKAAAGLNKILMGDQPSDHELRLLDIAFGHGVSRQFSSDTGWAAAISDVANAPRALMSSVDLSAPFRQGAVLARRKEFWTSFKPMMEAFGSERRALEINDDIIETIARSGADKTSLYVASPFGKLVDREEAFMSGFVEHLPFLGDLVNRSERAYVTFLNKLRVDAFESMGTRFKTSNPEERAALMEETAKWLNTATGRGNISPNSLMAHTNALFFSPRWFMSRLEMMNPKTWFNAPPQLRAEMAKDVGSFVGAGVMALGILKASGGAFGFDVNVEMDPRSSAFGKGKVGDTYYDLWAGFQPIARYVAQAMSGQRKTASGDLAEVDRATVLGRFAQSKLAPVPGFLLDALRGETFLGQEVDVKSGTGLSEQAAQRLAPLFVQDILTAVHHEGPMGFLKTLPAGLGVGASTYTTFSGFRDKLALEDTGYPYERLTGTQKQLLNQVHAKELAQYDEAAQKGSFRYEVERVNEDVRNREKEYAQYHADNRTSPREFNAVMQDLAAERAFRIQGVRDALGVEDEGVSLISRWLALRDEATAGGVTDYSKLEQLQEDFRATLSDPQDLAQLDDFTTFVHAPEAQAYFDAKKVVRDAGYWQQEGAAFDRFAAKVRAVDPSITTRRELELAAGRAATRAEAIRLGGLLKLVDRERDRRRDLLKLRSKPLREAVDAVYSNKPLPQPKGGLTKI